MFMFIVTMSYTQTLISFHVVERENNHNFLTWTYPTITEEQERHILQNCFTQDHIGCICLRIKNIWFYIHQQTTFTKKFAIILLTKEFEPNKYRILCDILGKKYLTCQNPVELVKLYLNLFTLGSCSVQENGTLYSCDLKNFESTTNIKDFIRSFELEIILLFNAILLKRRILLFNRNPELLQTELLTVTNLVPCRNANDYLYPLILTPNKLKGLSFYVAGTTNGELIGEEDLYDLFLNMESQKITISPKAEEITGITGMTKLHKDIATFLVKLAASDMSETEIKRQILQKTNNLLNILKSMASVTTENNVKMVTMNDLKSKNYQPPLENFLFNLALAENIMML